MQVRPIARGLGLRAAGFIAGVTVGGLFVPGVLCGPVEKTKPIAVWAILMARAGVRGWGRHGVTRPGAWAARPDGDIGVFGVQVDLRGNTGPRYAAICPGISLDGRVTNLI